MKSKSHKPALAVAAVEGRIHLIRDRKVILDADLAELYAVPTKALNQAVKRNSERFPDEFVFRLTADDVAALGSQSVTLDPDAANRSQNVTSSQKHRDPRLLPYAFTEHGALMAANILRSPRAVQMSVLIVQTFVRLRRMTASIDALARKVEELERATRVNRRDIEKIISAIHELMTPPEKTRREIGFHARP